MRLLLIRHGQIQSNADQVIDSRIPGPSLTRLGERQAAALPEDLAHEDIGAVWVSSMVRTHQTAAPLARAQELTPVERHGIHEIQGNHWELSGDPEHIAAYYDVVLSWACGDLDRRMPGGELGHDFFARYDAVVEEAVRSARSAGLGTVALVSHGTAIRCWTSRRTDNLAAAELEQRPLENTGVVVLEESADGERPWTCRSWMGEPVVGVGAGAHSGSAGGSIF
ncbi:histidine phosphatase family protein [Kocuria rosea]|uniref:Histidine phosphatase family protein n=1 Tax=Kocuria rosea TaxID=1275 RepID=A0A4R5Y6I5_KOCRO|nr:histidine phosphatase family protein [Kocuria rosea]TDL40163.1 histidine phosphatase family protein [Kocuria rosea]